MKKILVILLLFVFSSSAFCINFPSIFSKQKTEERYSSLDDYLQRKYKLTKKEVIVKYKHIGSGAEKIVRRMYLYKTVTGAYIGSLKVATIYNDEALVNKLLEVYNPGNMMEWCQDSNIRLIGNILSNKLNGFYAESLFRDEIFVPYYWAEGRNLYGKYVDIMPLGNQIEENRKGWIWFNSFVFFQRISFELDYAKRKSVCGLAIDTNFGNYAFNPHYTSYMDMFYVLDIPFCGVGDFMHCILESFFVMLDFYPQSDYQTYTRIKKSSGGLSRNKMPLSLTLPQHDFDLGEIYICVDAMIYTMQKYSVLETIEIISLIDVQATRYFRDTTFSRLIHKAFYDYARFFPNTEIRNYYKTMYAA